MSSNNIYDLIYAGEHRKKAERTIQGAYPKAVLGDASDFIHYGRFSVEMEIEEEEWLLFLFLSGIFQVSLAAGLIKRENPELYSSLIKRAARLLENESKQE